jgi:hypothetical protein
MITALRGGYFFFFAACITVMGCMVYLFLPETKGRTLERMDEIFGTAYGDLVDLEISDYRREVRKERGEVSGVGKAGDDEILPVEENGEGTREVA